MSAPFPDVMLLAAGLGTRLRPLTETVPKPLVRVAGQALLDRVIANATAEGARRFVVNAHHLAPQIVAHANRLNIAGAITVTVSDETAELLDTGGGVRHALPHLATDPILVMNTDAFWTGTDTPLSRMIETLRSGRANIVLLCVHPLNATGFRRSHDFCLDPHGRITRDSGAPVIYAGVALMRRALFAEAPAGRFSLNRLFETALEQDRLWGTAMGARWHHVGDPEGLREAEAALAGNEP